MMKYILRITCAILLALALYPSAALARTTLFFDAPTSVRPEAQIPVILKARLEQPINAVRIVIRFDPSQLAITGVDDRDSVVRHWLELPDASASGSLALEGIIPGGVGPGLSDTVTIARLTVRAAHVGSAKLSIPEALVYLNEPQPTEDQVTTMPLTLAVRADAPEIVVAPGETRSPDAEARLVREPSVHDGAWSLVFDVRADGHTVPVKIRERLFGFGGSWNDATSPYRLSDQRLMSIIEVGIASGSDIDVGRTIVPGRLQSIIALVLVAVIASVVRWRVWRRV